MLEPILIEKVWGGRRLARFGKHLPRDGMIGESWELADLDTTSASGAGGHAAHSPLVTHDDTHQHTLRDLVASDLRSVLGDALAAHPAAPRFPLLVKFLDATENLSVQVHPSPAYAQTHAEAHLKIECWYVLEAEPDSVIYKGVKPGVDARQFRDAIKDGSVAALMHAEPAVVGHMHNLPSGTVHALGAGVVVAEVQTPSDTTFRVFDWGRTNRELHIDQAMACIDFGPAPKATHWKKPIAIAENRRTLVGTAFFTVDETRMEREQTCSCPPANTDTVQQPVVLMQLAGSSRVAWDDDSSPLALPIGTTCVVPASVARRCVLTSTSDDCICLITTVHGYPSGQ